MIKKLFLILSFFLFVQGCDSGSSYSPNLEPLKTVSGPFPAKLTGEVIFTFHLGTDPGYDMISLDGYGDLQLLVTSALYDEIGISEGSSYQFSVEPMKTREFGNKEESYLIISGNKVDSN